MSRAPSFLREQAPPRARRGEWIALALLALALPAQLFFSQRTQLAADARWRPLVSAACDTLGCNVPAWREPAAFSMLSRDVIAVPGRPGVLRVQASFRNDARWAQAWPALRLSLSDADGRVIGRRTLQPGDYLDPAQGPLPLLEPAQSAQVAFLLREPSAATVAYTFEFR